MFQITKTTIHLLEEIIQLVTIKNNDVKFKFFIIFNKKFSTCSITLSMKKVIPFDT